MPERLKIATGGTSGVYYAYGTVLGDILSASLGIPVAVAATGGSVENIILVQDGKADLAFVQNDIMTYAYNGTHLFSTDGPRKDFAALAGLYPEVCQIVARRDIASVADLKGRRVSLGDRGGGTELNALQILESYGVAEADIKAERLNFGASVVALEAGQIDAFFATAGVPTPAISGLAASGQARLLPIGEAHARQLSGAYPFYTWQTVPSGAYPGMNEEVPTIAVQATLVASEKLSAGAVKKITAALFEHRAEIEAATGKALDPQMAMFGIPIPLHPGAEQYYRGK